MSLPFAEGWGTYDEWPVGKGWWPILDALHRDLTNLDPDYKIHQVKEKFGGLRYYCDGDGGDTAWGLIRNAEALCEVTCEECGKPGHLISRGGWLKTLCEAHGPEVDS